MRRPIDEPFDVLDALREWAQAAGFGFEDFDEPFDRFGTVVERFGSILAHASRGTGVGFDDDTKADGRSVRALDDMIAVGLRVPHGVALLDGFVAEGGNAAPLAVVKWDSSAQAYIVEGGRFYALPAEAFDALRAGRYAAPYVPRCGEDFGAWAFDFGAVLDGEGVA